MIQTTFYCFSDNYLSCGQCQKMIGNVTDIYACLSRKGCRLDAKLRLTHAFGLMLMQSEAFLRFV